MQSRTTGPGRREAWWPLLAPFVLVIALLDRAEAQPPMAIEPMPAVSLTARPGVASPAQDDATLHDVCFVGRHGWTVGDHGTIWKSDDSGQNWSFVPSPADQTLRSVCFLTDKIGWAAGGTVTPFTRTPTGVLLSTADGGESWQALGGRTLPYLYAVRFFDLESGIAVCEASADFPNGLLTTGDGGATWTALPGEAATGWQAGDFLSPRAGLVAGPRGMHALVGGGRLLPPHLDLTGLRAIRGVAIRRNGAGWMVGDGGLVIHTANGGAQWDSAMAIPRALRDVVDLNAVDVVDDHVWIAGRPGSAVWHSPDAGQTWETQPTGGSAPIESIQFSSATDGCAVGAFGRILQTADGGATWRAVRGEGRRVALLAIHAHASRVSLNLTTRHSAEDGYRSVTSLIARRDIGPDGGVHNQDELRLREASVSASANDAEWNWRFPISVPGLARDRERLIAEWSLLTDGRLPEALLGSLVTLLRTWQPDVVVTDEPPADDAGAALLHEALVRAISRAADPKEFPDLMTSAHLPTWQVRKLFVRLPDGAPGEAHLDPHEILPRLGTTTEAAAAAAASRLHDRNMRTRPRESFRLLRATPDLDPAVTSRTLFAGLSIAPGSAARRELGPLKDLDYDRLERIAQRQRNFEAYVDRALDDPRQAAQLIAQLRQVVGELPRDQAAGRLASLAGQYRARGDWDLVESTLTELVEQFPEQPVAVEAMRWLLTFWASDEMGWQRLRAMNASKDQVVVDRAAVQANLSEVEEILRGNGDRNRVQQLQEQSTSPLRIVPAGGQVRLNDGGGQREFAADRWREKAFRLAALLEQRSPAELTDPRLQFTLAALARHRGDFPTADAVYRKFLAGDPRNLWHQTALGEIWLQNAGPVSPKAILICRRTPAPPILDGVLSDTCWADSQEVPLLSEQEAVDITPEGFIGSRSLEAEAARPREDGSQRAIVMLAYDDRFLYFAARVPRRESLPDAGPVYPGRTHDADLADYDRLTLALDVDRDYATHYQFEIDQRGWTRDGCWGDPTWNPQWYVAATGETDAWSIETAVPFDQLAARPPIPGTAWGGAILRTMPAIGSESWTHPHGAVPRPEAFGLIRFQ